MSYNFSVLRELRGHRKLTINELSKACKVSYVALSKLERNQGNPELRTLDRISHALGISTHHLLALAESRRPVQVAGKTCKILGKAECRHVNLDGTRVFVVRAPKGATGAEDEFHGDDYERCFVVDGQVKITIRGTEYLLSAGEGLTWDSLLDHTYDAMDGAMFVTVLTPKRM